jgi:hypothetical protein
MADRAATNQPAAALFGGPILNYNHHPFGGPSSRNRKPTFEPPPEARENFARDTGDDKVFLCPSCEEELAYNEAVDDNGPPTKKARTKKDQALHYFWAVKACGHVSRISHH